MDFLPLDDLPELPAEETQEVEYKSARGVVENPKKGWDAAKAKLQKAASGFWNSGGGTIWFGLADGTGEPEEWKLPLKRGKQPIRDWVDQVLHEGVAPCGDHHTEVYADAAKSSSGIVAVKFAASNRPPHMMLEKKHYFIRAGRHTVPASHYVLQALTAYRGTVKPEVVHTCETQPGDLAVYDVVVLVANDQPAFDLSVQLKGLHAKWQPEASSRKFGAVTPSYPARLMGLKREDDLKSCVSSIQVDYRDVDGAWHRYEAKLNPPPKRISPPRRKVDVVGHTI